ncbi:hypothetical protein GQ43DRAFT_449282 [Delitschia confertaspora ATCC 74209]|uniref:MARVEL domain-containing protein n=1 Tax=Delitschia confertaspora ATCC 74209 TaxID=1513339 RepID=A0A9P4JJZ6_9PLEO|nr:hypothetical protein GQ43DRAFT_449282 [Delitschia confertaspora ATCC 74209]
MAINFSPGNILRLTARLLQFVLALTVCGLYGTDLDAAHKAHVYADSKWVYAVTVAGLSAISSIVLALSSFKTWFFSWWDGVLFILWVAVFGTFGKIYLKADTQGSKGVTRMKHAVWVDMVNMVLWFLTACYGAWAFWKAGRKSKAWKSEAEV